MEKKSDPAQSLTEALLGMDKFQMKLRELAPRNDVQRSLQSRALALSNELIQMRWLVLPRQESKTLAPFLIVLVFWLAIVFAGFGMYTSNDSTVLTALFVCALSVSGAIYLIEELDRPFDGLLRISGGPLRDAVSHIGG